MSNFCKHEDCPSSQELLAFQSGNVETKDGINIRRHIALCDFCAAEIDFYSHHPQAEGKAEVEEIPKPLYDLAKALLLEKRDMSSIYKMMKDSD